MEIIKDMTIKTFTHKPSSSILVVSNNIKLLPQNFYKKRYYDGEWFYILKLYVPKSHRNKGIATILINKMLKWADKNKYNLILEVTPYEGSSYNNLIKFYERFGFIYKIGYMERLYK